MQTNTHTTYFFHMTLLTVEGIKKTPDFRNFNLATMSVIVNFNLLISLIRIGVFDTDYSKNIRMLTNLVRFFSLSRTAEKVQEVFMS